MTAVTRLKYTTFYVLFAGITACNPYYGHTDNALWERIVGQLDGCKFNKSNIFHTNIIRHTGKREISCTNDLLVCFITVTFIDNCLML